MVFDAKTLDVERMVRAAHAITAQTIPPLVRISASEEDEGALGVDYFEVRPAEKLGESVSAILRIARASRWERRMVVDASSTQDPNGRPLTFHWKLLRGDPERVHIKPLDEKGTKAEIRVAWHERRPVEPGSELLSSRVDVGVFADNGTNPSAPAFISWYFPPYEKRVYDANHRIPSIEYRPVNSKECYTDLALVTPASWTDAYHYDAKGNLLGWTRTRKDKTEEFTRHGALVAKKDAKGRPIEANLVRYVRKQKSPMDWPVLEQEPTTVTLVYAYASDDDLLGTMIRRQPEK